MPDLSEYPELLPDYVWARLETTVDLLRREWRDGCPAGMAYQTALGSVRRLRGVAATKQIAGDLAVVIADLEAYGILPPKHRPAALTKIAAAIKQLIPLGSQLGDGFSVQSVPSVETDPMPMALEKDHRHHSTFFNPQVSSVALITALHLLSPSDFERVIAWLLQAEGFDDVQVTGGANDRGVDIVCYDAHGSLVAVQCKRYDPSKKIGALAIQHFTTMAFHRQAQRQIFVTTADFTVSAQQQAQEFNVEVVGSYQLAGWLAQHQHIADWVYANQQSFTGSGVMQPVGVRPVTIPYKLIYNHRESHDQVRLRLQEFLSRYPQGQPATVESGRPRLNSGLAGKGTSGTPEHYQRADRTLEQFPLVTPEQFRQAIALRRHQCAADTKPKKSRSRKHDGHKVRVYLLENPGSGIQDYAAQFDFGSDHASKNIELERCHYLAPGQIVSANDLWNFWTEAKTYGATTTGRYFTNTYFSCGAYSYIAEQPNFGLLQLRLIDGEHLAHYFTHMDDEFMALANCSSLPACFVAGDIGTQGEATPTRQSLWRRILGS